jgi:hypothetical protein
MGRGATSFAKRSLRRVKVMEELRVHHGKGEANRQGRVL